jgi:hypothetical protein
VEINQEHIINVDYNMSMPIDLIDRDVFLPFPKAYDPQAVVDDNAMGFKREEDLALKEKEKRDLEELRSQYLDEKDKFLLSDRITFEIEHQSPEKVEKKIKLPARYELIDKVNKWGVDIRNPIAVRQLEQADAPENEIVLTLE